MTTRFIDEKEMRQLTQAVKPQLTKSTRYIVLRKNEPIFELRTLSKKDATLDRLQRDLAEAEEDVRKGRVYTQAEVEKMLNL